MTSSAQCWSGCTASWLNLVEIFFGKFTDKAIRRGVFKSVPDLVDAIDAYLTANNNNPEPFLWTAATEEILAKSAAGASASTQSPTKTETPH